MQAQIHTRNAQNQTITANQSLATVQTMLRAGLGCITYLRDLLPVDNFSESHFTSSSEDSLSSSIESPSASQKLRRTVSAFKIMTVSRGFTEEGDKLLNYLEYGIFDALKHRYLRSFIFAICLDNRDPNNIVEAYTFNFNYYTIPGTNTVIPIVSLGEDSTSAVSNSMRDPMCFADPAAEAARRGRPPTLGEVKKSVKALLRRLINATTQMDSLPKRRYATFKLFYTNDTPPDYEPPHFQPADAGKDRWYFTTHTVGEQPEKWSVGGLETGYHAVNLNVASVAAYLPSTTDHNDAPFMGITTGSQGLPSGVQALTPAQEAVIRAREIDIQVEDATRRSIVWSVEGDDAWSDADAEGEDDDDYIRAIDGSYERKTDSHAFAVDSHVPIGIRHQDGHIESLRKVKSMKVAQNGENKLREKLSTVGAVDGEEEIYYDGVSEKVPTCVGELNVNQAAGNPQFEQTQQICTTQEIFLPPSSPVHRRNSSSSAVTDKFCNITLDAGRTLATTQFHAPAPDHGVAIDTKMPKNMVKNGAETMNESEDCEMLDVETQAANPTATAKDSIESFGLSEPDGTVEDIECTPIAKRTRKTTQAAEVGVDRGIQCDCGVTIEDACTFCEGGCGGWFHLWCMGYHSTTDKRIPPKFICFDCRVRGDSNWDLIELHLYPQMISKFKDLTLFRRAIKIVENYDPSAVSEFARLLGCENVVARQLFKRLEVEGFIVTEQKMTDDLDLLETRRRAVKSKAKAKGKQVNPRKNLHKAKYMFNKLSRTTPAYQDYFSQDPAVENRLLGLSNLAVGYLQKASFKHSKDADVPADSLSTTPPQPSCTENPQVNPPSIPGMPLLVPHPRVDGVIKRKFPSSDRPYKKVKISIGLPVDLGD